MSVPIVLFSWAYDFYRWPAGSFSESMYGTVYWDTHIYHMGSGSLTQMKSSNWDDYEAVRRFTAEGNTVFAGEWTVAGMDSLGKSQLADFAAWFVQHLGCAGAGSAYWNFDGPGTWGFAASGIRWQDVFADRAETFRADGAPFGIRTFHGGWLSASDSGSVFISPSKSQWEEWTPYLYTAGGTLRVALQSWHGKWLSVKEDGTLAATADSHEKWEELTPFTYSSHSQYRMALRSWTGKWFTADQNGHISATAASHDAWEELTPVYCDASAATESSKSPFMTISNTTCKAVRTPVEGMLPQMLHPGVSDKWCNAVCNAATGPCPKEYCTCAGNVQPSPQVVIHI